MTERIDYAMACRRTRRRWVKKMLSEGWAIVPSAPHQKQRSGTGRKATKMRSWRTMSRVMEDGNAYNEQPTVRKVGPLKWMASEQIERYGRVLVWRAAVRDFRSRAAVERHKQHGHVPQILNGERMPPPKRAPLPPSSCRINQNHRVEQSTKPLHSWALLFFVVEPTPFRLSIAKVNDEPESVMQ